jgi:hypothetical protein
VNTQCPSVWTRCQRTTTCCRTLGN